MSDTLHKYTDTIYLNNNNGIDLLEKVNNFYDASWNKLIIVGSVGFAIIGIVIPLIVQWYQKRTLKISEHLLKKEIEVVFHNYRQEFDSQVDKIVSQKLGEMKEEISNLRLLTVANTFHMQGNLHYLQDDYIHALQDFITAGRCYAATETFQGLHDVLSAIKDDVLDNLTDAEIRECEIQTNKTFESLLEEISVYDDTGITTTLIRDIKVILMKKHDEQKKNK